MRADLTEALPQRRRQTRQSARVARAEIPEDRSEALGQRTAVPFLRAVEACMSPCDRAIVLIPFHAGTRIGEIVGLDTDDVQLSARKGTLRIVGTGEKQRSATSTPVLVARILGDPPG